jgi:hypothetical protein
MKDLSSLADGSLVFDSSMQGGNTLSVNPPFSPPGSESEATHGIPLHSRPNPDIGPGSDGQLTGNRKNDSGSVPHTNWTWRKL